MSTGDNVSSHTGGCGGNYAISALRKEDDTEEEHVLLQKEKKMELHVRMLNDLLMHQTRAVEWAWKWAWLCTCFCVEKESYGVI